MTKGTEKMTFTRYTPRPGLQIAILDSSIDPDWRAERLQRARFHYFQVRRVRHRQQRRGGKARSRR